MGDDVEGEQVGLERGTDCIGKNSLALISLNTGNVFFTPSVQIHQLSTYRLVHLVTDHCLLTSNYKFCHSIDFLYRVTTKIVAQKGS